MAGLVAAAAGAGAWWWLTAASPGTRGGSGTPINVLLVTLDTVRADHLGCYGDAEARTPVLDGLAARGVRFETAVAHAPITGPSHASILTGLTPLGHGVRNNGGFVLPKTIPTLAETLAGAGYRTGAFVSGFPLERRFHYDRGFEVYDDHFPHGNDPRRAPYVERPADQTTALAIRWLDDHVSGKSPWFLWVHYYDPHSPYEPPGELARQFATHPYDGEIAFVDTQLGVLLARLGQAGLNDRTIVLVTADHGESLGEHGEATHGMFLYDATLKVPWIIAGPGIPRGRTTPVVGRGVDVAPTLLDYVGLAFPKPIEGRSVRPAIEGRPMSDEASYAESLFANLHLHWAPLHAWRTARWKLVEAPRPELYDLEHDRGELNDKAASDPRRVEGLRRPLYAALRTRTPDASTLMESDAADRLRALGYIGGGTPTPFDQASTLRDPKDMLPILKRLEHGMEMARIDPATAARELTAVVKEAPEAALPRRYRAIALGASGHYDEAIADMRILERAGALSTSDLIVFGDDLRLAGRIDEALAVLDRASALQEDSPLLWLVRASALMTARRIEEASKAYEHAVAIAPDYAEALCGLGDVAFVKGDMATAATFYERALKATPGDSGALAKLGVVRMRAGQRDEAIDLFRRAIAADPANNDALLYMAGAMVSSGRPAEAIPYFERAVTNGMRTTMLFNGLGMTKLQLGDRAGAAAALHESLKLDPKQPQITAMLAQIK